MSTWRCMLRKIGSLPLLLPLLLIVCMAGVVVADETETTGTLAATIVDPSDQTPLKAVDISVGDLKGVTGSLGTFKIKGIPAGPAEVNASAEGYVDGAWQFEIKAGEVTEPGCLGLLPVRYRAHSAIIVEGQPCGATVALNGRLLRERPGSGAEPLTTPLLITSVSSGTYKLDVDKVGYQGDQFEVEVTKGELSRLLTNLQRQKGGAGAWPGGGSAVAAAIGGVALIAAVSSGGGDDTFTIAGHVTQAVTGSPIAGVEVHVGSSSTTTNSQGAYSVSGLSAGTYTVSAELSPYTFTPSSRSVTVNSTVGDVDDADFVGALPPDEFSISGTVYLGEGTLAGVLVTLEPMGTAEQVRAAQTQTTTTGGNGAYSFTGLAAGQYRISPSFAGYSFNPTERTPTVNAANGNATGQDFTATADTYSICGTVWLGEGTLGDIDITLTPMTELDGVRLRQTQTVVTDRSGEYCFDNLPAGQYRVAPAPNEAYTFAPTERTPTVNAANGSATGQDFAATPATFSICGTVMLNGEEPLAGIEVMIEGMTYPEHVGTRQLQAVTTGQDGAYCFDDLPEGQYRVYPSNAEFTFDPTQRTPTVNPTSGDAMGQDFNATLNTYSISGTVSEGESGLQGVLMTLEPASTPAGVRAAQTQTVTTGQNGAYSFAGLPAGSYRIYPTLTEYTFDPGEQTPTVNATNGDAAGVDFTGTLNLYSISGTVAEGETGMGGVQMTLEYVLGPTRVGPRQVPGVTTQPDGSYSFTGLPAGQYRVTPSLTEYTFDPAERTPTVNEANGDAVDQDFSATLNTYSVSGQVYTLTSVGRQGVANATVTIEAMAGPVGVRQLPTPVTTSSNGNYVFSGLPAGQYRVTAAHTEADIEHPELTPTVNQSLGDADDEDFLAVPYTYSVSGIVLFGEQGLAGVTVEADILVSATSGVMPAQTHHETTTITDGSYSFDGLPAGQWRIRPTFSEYYFTPSERTPTINSTNGNAINQDFTAARKTYSVSGVVDLDGAGMQGVMVTLEEVVAPVGTAQTPQPQTTTTGADGSYSFDDLLAGQYRVYPSDNEAAFSPTERTPTVNETNGDATGQDFSATLHTYQICGRVYDGSVGHSTGGLEGVTVTLTPAGQVTAVGTAQTAASSTTTSSSGDYCFEVTAGQYTVVPEFAEWDFSPEERSVTVNYQTGDALDQDFVGTLKTYSVSGTVTANGTGLGSVTITLESYVPPSQVQTAAIGPLTTTTITDGTYSFASLPAGQYRVTAARQEWVLEPGERTPEVNENVGDATGVDFTATQNLYSVSGRVYHLTTTGDEGLSGIEVVLEPVVLVAGVDSAQTPDPDQTATTGEDGTYSFEDVPAGEYRVAPNTTEWAFEPPERRPVVNLTNGDATGQDFEASDPRFCVCGHVYYEDVGNPLPGITVYIEPQASPTGVGVQQSPVAYTAVTDATGSYCRAVPEGQYLVYPQYYDWAFSPTSRLATVDTANPFALDQDFIAVPDYPSETSGTVIDEGEAFLPGTLITARLAICGGGGPSWTATTITDGSYAISGLPHGLYTLTASLTGYTFDPTQRQPELTSTSPSASGQDFTGTTVNVTSTTAFVTSMACLQTRGGMGQITFTLSADAAVTAEVLNIAGRPVRMVAVDSAMEAGTATLLWDGRNSRGLAVPSGMYIIRLHVRDTKGAQSQAIGRLNVSR